MEKLLERIERIKDEIGNLGEMHPGSLSEQYNACGNPNCRCNWRKTALHNKVSFA